MISDIEELKNVLTKETRVRLHVTSKSLTYQSVKMRKKFGLKGENPESLVEN